MENQTSGRNQAQQELFVTVTIDDDNLEMLKNELKVKSVKGK